MSRWGKAVLWSRGQKLRRDQKVPPFPGRTVIIAYKPENVPILLQALKMLGVWPDSINSMEVPTAASSGPFLFINPKDECACVLMRTLIALGPVRVLSVRLEVDKTNDKKVHITWEDVSLLFVDEAEGRRGSLPEVVMQRSFDTLSIPPVDPSEQKSVKKP